ncbi:MAG: InlB B-repeat-containing protein, partial [Peptococcaceae bacterium]|nr:InlB B-repeat-containing protein [Peptococcaceae bacterium]
MNYFSKNKKWMAYLILLTFLFTSIMPTNLATGDSMAYADDGLCNVVFKDANGDTIANTERTVKAGETTEAPVAPEIANKVFVGWNDGTQTHTGHTLTINADTEFTATYRDLDDVFVQIEYLYEDGSVALPPFEAFVEKGTAYNKTVASPALEGFTAAPATVTINESAISGDIKQTVKYTGANVDYKIEYRQQQLDGTYVVVDTVTGNAKTGTVVESELKEYTGFTPVINAEQQMRLGSGENVLTVDYNRNEYLLTVDTDGGSYIAPAKLKYGAAIAPTAPTKLGYTFNEWKVTGTQNNAPATMPANDLSITAQWTNNATANYTVVYWQQNAKDLTKYDYKESASKTGNVGANATYDAKSYAGFAVKPVTPVTVNADGSTVVNVYYDRINYSIYFWLYQNRNWVKQDNLTITAPYGTDISGQWNDDAHSQYMWYTSQSQTTSIGTQGTMPLNGKFPGLDSYTNNAYGDTTSTVTIYYKEWISNTQSTELGRGKLPSRWTINEGDIIDLEGFTYRSMNKNSKTLYYTRNSYSITFENASGISAATGIPYEKAITSYQPTGTITPPASVDSDYVFGGWYTSPACEKGTEVNWSSIMPAHNQIFY